MKKRRTVNNEEHPLAALLQDQDMEEDDTEFVPDENVEDEEMSGETTEDFSECSNEHSEQDLSTSGTEPSAPTSQHYTVSFSNDTTSRAIVAPGPPPKHSDSREKVVLWINDKDMPSTSSHRAKKLRSNPEAPSGMRTLDPLDLFSPELKEFHAAKERELQELRRIYEQVTSKIPVQAPIEEPEEIKIEIAILRKEEEELRSMRLAEEASLRQIRNDLIAKMRQMDKAAGVESPSSYEDMFRTGVIPQEVRDHIDKSCRSARRYESRAKV